MDPPHLYSIKDTGQLIQHILNLSTRTIRFKYRDLQEASLSQHRSFLCKGVYRCLNCKKSWGSTNTTMQISLTITESDPEYSAYETSTDQVETLYEFSLRVFKQGCEQCKTKCRPRVDERNIDNLVKTVRNYEENKRGGAKVQEYWTNVNNAKDKHKEWLCEACKQGRCGYQISDLRKRRKGKGKGKGKRDEEGNGKKVWRERRDSSDSD